MKKETEDVSEIAHFYTYTYFFEWKYLGGALKTI